MLSGCALHRSAPGRAPTPGHSGVVQDLQRYIADVRAAAAAARPGQPSTIEGQDRALAALRLRLTTGPTAALHRELADAYMRLGVLDAAQSHFTAALRLAPRDAAAYDGRARAWRKAGFPRFALGDAHRAVFLAPASPAYRNTLGTILLKLGHSADARDQFARVLKQNPRASYALNNMCYVDLLRGDSHAAVEWCRTAVREDATLVAAHNNLALAYAATGDTSSAQDEFEAAGSASTASYNLGVALLATRQFADAAHAFDRALAANPRLSDARRRAQIARTLALESASKRNR